MAVIDTFLTGFIAVGILFLFLIFTATFSHMGEEFLKDNFGYQTHLTFKAFLIEGFTGWIIFLFWFSITAGIIYGLGWLVNLVL